MTSTVYRDWPLSVRVAAVLTAFAAVCGLLYWGRAVLIPLALAGLLTFLFTPLVARLERLRLRRVPAVVLVVVLAGMLLSLVGWIVSSQLTTFAAEFPSYRNNIRDKVTDLREMFQGGPLEKVQQTLDEVKKELEQDAKDEQVADEANSIDGSPTGEELPPEATEEVSVPVRLVPEEYLFPDTDDLTPYLGGLATAGLVIVLVFFMLIYREDVLSRLVSLAGTRSLAVTTRALDDASRRISRYLLMQFFINASFGLAVGTGLFFLDLPYSALWGFSSFILRYIPYIGPWVAAVLPITVSLVHFSGWSSVFFVIGLFVALELFSNNVLEPLLYGRSVGLSPVAVIFAAAFWTWMWGPIGLILATPLTVCLVVLGEHIPALAIFDRLLSDRPALDPHLWLYQRLLAGDEEDAEEIALDHLAEHSPEATCDDLLLPTLLFARRERAGRRIDDDDVRQIQQILADIIDGLPDWRPAPSAGESSQTHSDPALAIGFPTQQADVLVLKLLARLLDADKCTLEILSPDMLIAERIAAIDERRPAFICLSSLPPGGLTQARAITKSLRSRYPDAKIVVGRWATRPLSEKGLQLLKQSGASAVASSLTQLQEVVVPMIQFHVASQPSSEVGDEVAPRELHLNSVHVAV